MAWSASRCSSKSSEAALGPNSSSQSWDFLISSLIVFLSADSSLPPSPASSASCDLSE